MPIGCKGFHMISRLTREEMKNKVALAVELSIDGPFGAYNKYFLNGQFFQRILF